MTGIETLIVGLIEMVIVGVITGAVLGTWAKRQVRGPKGD